ncbi:MAG: hypothetical protein WAO71_14420 [Gallionella sp.]
MKIEFTRKEYQNLLDMLYIANWVLTAHKLEDDPRVEAYEALEQKIYAHAQPMGFGDLIEYMADDEEYYPTKKYEDTSPAAAFIQEFENDSFWEELIDRLANRDLIKQAGGVENLSSLSVEQHFGLLHPLETKYSAEFEQNGLDGIRIVAHKEPV